MSLPFRDRHDAGRQLGELMHRCADSRAMVLGIPRGGVPVAYEVAHALRSPLDIFLQRHLPAPADPDVSLGVVASGGVRLVDAERLAALQVTEAMLDEITHRERLALLARERTYRGQQAVMDLRDRLVVLVDDGTTAPHVLTGLVAAVREHQPLSVILASPLLEDRAAAALRHCADEVVCVVAPPPPLEPGRWYLDMLPISHTEVRALLALAQAEAQSRELAVHATH